MCGHFSENNDGKGFKSSRHETLQVPIIFLSLSLILPKTRWGPMGYHVARFHWM